MKELNEVSEPEWRYPENMRSMFTQTREKARPIVWSWDVLSAAMAVMIWIALLIAMNAKDTNRKTELFPYGCWKCFLSAQDIHKHVFVTDNKFIGN